MKSLGQMNFEAYWTANGYSRTDELWESLPHEHEAWEKAAKTVAQEALKRDQHTRFHRQWMFQMADE
jgi:hypothetical protein